MENSQFSESAFEYLLREALLYQPPLQEGIDDMDAAQKQSQRLEEMGYDVGFRLMERMSEKQKFLGFQDLDCVKFMCRDFWKVLFGKTIDKLQTNRRGVFMLFDLQFQWIEKYTSGMEMQHLEESTKQMINTLLSFPCGIMRGGLTNLGMSVNVTADLGTLPQVTFSLRKKTNS